MPSTAFGWFKQLWGNRGRSVPTKSKTAELDYLFDHHINLNVPPMQPAIEEDQLYGIPTFDT